MQMGDIIRENRERLGLTQEELGAMVGVNKGAVWKWENGKVQNLKRSIIQKLAMIFQIPLSTLLGLPNTGGENEQKESLADVEHQEAEKKAAELFSRLSEAEQQQALTYIEFLLHKR